jgi:hypothetical protein
MSILCDFTVLRIDGGTRGGTEHDIRVVEYDMLPDAVCLATENLKY